MDKQEIISSFLLFMQWEERPLKNWYVGITQDLEKRLAQHNVPRDGKYNVHEYASSTKEAREIEKELIEKYGLSGAPGGGDENSKIVYVFLMTAATNPKINE
jgi:hypothetical protein